MESSFNPATASVSRAALVTTASWRNFPSSKWSTCDSARTSKACLQHSHADQVDSFYVIEGEAEFVVAMRSCALGRAPHVAAPLGVTHGFRNVGDGELRMLNIHAPGTGFARRLRDG